jgi:hypothetical protein
MELVHLDEGAKHPVLGPVYFSAREMAEKLMAGADAAEFKVLIDKAAADFGDKLQERVEYSLMNDVESNVQNFIWNEVDRIVQGLLSGERWVMERYALGERYRCEKVRATVAQHLGEELKAGRLADLEAEVERLKADLKFCRER